MTLDNSTAVGNITNATVSAAAQAVEAAQEVVTESSEAMQEVASGLCSRLASVAFNAIGVVRDHVCRDRAFAYSSYTAGTLFVIVTAHKATKAGNAWFKVLKGTKDRSIKEAVKATASTVLFGSAAAGFIIAPTYIVPHAALDFRKNVLGLAS